MRAFGALGASNRCTVSLFDSVGQLLDSVVVNFTTTDTIIDVGAQTGVAPNGTVLTPVVPGAAPVTCDRCGFVDVMCLMRGLCGGGLLKAGAAGTSLRAQVRVH